MSDSYVLTPSNPTINNDGSFNLVYTTASIPVGDPATYNLVNTSSNTVMKSVVGSLFNANIITDFSYSTSATMPTFGAYVIYCLPNGNFWIDFLNTNAAYPYSVVYDPSGRKILENNGISSTYSMTSDSSYVYGFNSAGIMSRYTLEGAYIPGSNINTNMWFISVAYCPVDGFIYGARNGSPNEIYRINRETGSRTLFRTATVQNNAGITGVSFNFDYSYLYYMTIGNGYIYYIERTNTSNTNTVKTTTNADATIGSITATLTMNRASNILYSVDDNTPGKIYYFKLLTATTCEPAASFYTLTNNSTRAIHYSDITNKLYIAPNGERKLYIFSPINTLSYLNIQNGALFNGANTLQIQRNTTNFGNPISFNTTLSSDSYAITPIKPNIADNTETFDVVYTTEVFQLADDASYALLNTTTGSVLKTIRPTVTAFNTISAAGGNDFPIIYEAANNNIFVSFSNNPSPWSRVYTDTGTIVTGTTNSTSRIEIYGMTSDGTYLYANHSQGFNRYTLDGVYFGSRPSISTWLIGVEYNPNDGFIYGALNGSGIYKYDVSNNTGSTIANIGGSDSFGGIAFNSDYSYMYVVNRVSGRIRYFQRTNVSNTGILTSIDTTGHAITCNRSKNILYISSPADPYVYSTKLITNTTSTSPQRMYTLSAGSYSLYYSNTQNRLIVLDNNRKVYIFNDETLSFLYMPTELLNGGANILQIQRNGINFGNPITVNATCFLEGTRILCLTDTFEEQYVKIENMKKGMLVKTHLHGFKPVHSIGKGKIYNPTKDTMTTDRLYMISKKKYSDLIDDLYITGNHSVLVPSLTDEQHEKITDYMKEIYITDDQYRLPACLDERFTECSDYGNKTIWHFALEHDDIFENYGVYANGLLVETCSIRYLTELSTLELQE